LWHICSGQNCEASRVSRCWGTVLQIRLFLSNNFITFNNRVTWKRFSVRGPCRLLRNATIKQLLRELFSMRSVPRLQKKLVVHYGLVTHMEEGSDTSTVTLRVVGGDETGSLKSETVKYGHECQSYYQT
jgi:hypothetical protein